MASLLCSGLWLQSRFTFAPLGHPREAFELTREAVGVLEFHSGVTLVGLGFDSSSLTPLTVTQINKKLHLTFTSLRISYLLSI